MQASNPIALLCIDGDVLEQLQRRYGNFSGELA